MCDQKYFKLKSYRMRSNKSPYIFIVEDDHMYSEYIKYGLEESEYSNVEVLSSAQECLDNLHKMPDVVLLDYKFER